MRCKASKHDQARRVKACLRVIQHYEKRTHNLSNTWRLFKTSRAQSYTWLNRSRTKGMVDLRG